MKIYDTHAHCDFSPDGRSSAEALCAQAKKKDFGALVITDHFDLSPEHFGHGFYLNIEKERNKELARLKGKYQNDFPVLNGLELGQPTHFHDFSKDFLSTRTFDFILGSIHILNDRRDVYWIDYTGRNVVDQVFRQYFNDMLELLNFGGFDSLAHLDYPLRVLKDRLREPTIDRYGDWVRPVLKRAAEEGIGIEINTRGLFDWQNRVGPETWVLEMYRSFGGETVTVGSDAHTAEGIGAGFYEGVLAAKTAGFSHICYFCERKPIKISI